MLVSYNDSMKYQFLISCLLVTSLLFSSITLTQPNQELTSISDLKDFDQRSIGIKKSNDQIIDIKVLIADTSKKTKQGLMYVESLPDNIGMLFIFKPPRKVSMWMKNTHISLDILFIDENQTIIKIHNEAKPFNLKSIQSNLKVKWVLEINGGLAKELNIKKGDNILF